MTSSTIANLGNISNVQGVCYSPAPSDDAGAPPPKYFDTDFANSSFPDLWSAGSGSGRNDIATMTSLGINFIRLYNWSVPPAPGTTPGQYQRNHLPFLAACATANIRVMVPVSNYFMQQIQEGNGATVKADILAMVTEVYDGSTDLPAAAAVWGMGNEFDLATGLYTVEDLATATEYLSAAEQSLGIPAANLLPVCAPVSYAIYNGLPPSISALQQWEAAIKANNSLGDTFWTARCFNAVNSFNPGSDLATFAQTTYPTYFPNTPLMFTEMGVATANAGGTDAEQAAYVAAQISNTEPSGTLLGRCVFQFLDQTSMKTGTEATFGMLKFAATPPAAPTGTISPSTYVPGGGDTYPIDALSEKALYGAVKTAWGS